ncbi:MAG: SDR family oxidoreductase [Rhodoluna sp.]
MAKIAITGSTGFVGSNIAAVLQKRGHEVVGIGRRQAEVAPPWPIKVVDFSNISSIADALTGCDAVIHCAINNDFNKLVENREAGYDAYPGMTQRVTLAANHAGAKPILISTDWVMDGTQHRVPETDPGNPINFYGALKILSEQVIRDLAPTNGAVCRIAGVMGQHQITESPRSQDVGFGYFVFSLVEALTAGKTFTVWGGDRVNKVTTPSLAAEIGAQLERVILRSGTGTFHLVGDDAVSRMELAKLTCEVFDLDESLLLESEPPVDQLFPAAVPVDSSLGNDYTKKVLGIAPQSIKQILEAFKLQLATGEVNPISPADKE